MKKCYRIHITGTVQGVGFRPFIYAKAVLYNITGYVVNTPDGVYIEAEGVENAVRSFITCIREQHPELASIEHIDAEEITVRDYTRFEIRESRVDGSRRAFFSPDIALCEDCTRELLDNNDRRYHYPLITCINCGPRFSIVKDIPYDRKNTAMDEFTLCSYCSREYGNPLNRRFHAQPVACPECGPVLQLYDNRQTFISDNTGLILDTVIDALKSGQVVAMKGIGGYHIVVDAANDEAVMMLRQRKQRPFKPFAVMVPGIKEGKQIARINRVEEQLLCSRFAPIVLVDKTGNRVSEHVAPGLQHLGVMLPYAPLHHLLFDRDRSMVLVMTSANISDEPILYSDNDALRYLTGIVDYIVTYNREIYGFSDDSVLFVEHDIPVFVRRSRGYVPAPIVTTGSQKRFLAAGGDLKNCFAISFEKYIILSQYFGDMVSPSTHAEYNKALDHFSRIYAFTPDVIVSDMHPGYYTVKFAEELAREKGIGHVQVQHHHAHVASVLEDRDFNGPCIGIVFDGTGYGPDGKLWGSEIMVADKRKYERLAHFSYFGLPGGEQAITDVWKIGVSLLYSCFGNNFVFFDNHGQKDAVLELLGKGLNVPDTCSIGRIFDGVSAILGITETVSCEAEAAILLEEAARRHKKKIVPFVVPVSEQNIFNTGALIAYITGLVEQGEAVEDIAYAFHQSIITSTVKQVQQIADESGINTVTLSGGAFQNRILLQGLLDRLDAAGLTVLVPGNVPFNDQCLALGQVAVAKEMLKNCPGKQRQ